MPRGSAAGPVGKVQGIVSFGSERVEEGATLESFYAPGGGFEFFTNGHSPVSLEILSKGHYVHLGGAGGFGPELIAEVPLVSTVPGAPFASVESISVKAGSARKVHGKPVYYGRVPKKCPKGGFPIKTEMIFDEGGAVPPVPEVVTATYKSPLPRGSTERRRPLRAAALPVRRPRAAFRRAALWDPQPRLGRWVPVLEKVCRRRYANIRSYEPETVPARRRARGGARPGGARAGGGAGPGSGRRPSPAAGARGGAEVPAAGCRPAPGRLRRRGPPDGW